MYDNHPKARWLPVWMVMALVFSLSTNASEKITQEGTFQGRWSLKGSFRPVEEVDGEVVAVTYRVEGNVTITDDSGLGPEFAAFCVGVHHVETGGVGRCNWTDKNGDNILIDLSGSSALRGGAVGESRGKLIDGTGRYEGVEGDIQMDWIFVESVVDHSKLKGYVTKLKGNWKLP